MKELFRALFSGLLCVVAISSNLNFTSTFSLHPELSTFATLLDQYPEAWNEANAGNVTILAPSNNAIANYLESTGRASNDIGAFTETLMTYHILRGTHSKTQIQNAVQFLPTYLTNLTYNNVTGGQRVEARSSGDQVYFLSGLKSRSNAVTTDIVYFGLDYENIAFIHIIDNVLNIPTDFDGTISDAQLHGLATVLSEITPNQRLNNEVANETDWTFFGPNSTNISIQGWTEQSIYDLEAYYFVQGPVRYSTDLTDGLKLRTLEGQDVTITVDGNGTIYVNAAKIIQPDFLWTKGVLHLIESALDPNDSSARPLLPMNTTTVSVSSSGLSTGAKAGIGVGAAIGGLLLIALAIFLFRKQKKHKQQSKHSGAAELDSREKGGIREIQGKALHPELPGGDDAVRREELDSTERSSTVHELG